MLLREESVEGDHALVPSTPETTVSNNLRSSCSPPPFKKFSIQLIKIKGENIKIIK